jgi:hypothetical protein
VADEGSGGDRGSQEAAAVLMAALAAEAEQEGS